jgi:hypothetical protein
MELRVLSRAAHPNWRRGIVELQFVNRPAESWPLASGLLTDVSSPLIRIRGSPDIFLPALAQDFEPIKFESLWDTSFNQNTVRQAPGGPVGESFFAALLSRQRAIILALEEDTTY